MNVNDLFDLYSDNQVIHDQITRLPMGNLDSRMLWKKAKPSELF